MGWRHILHLDERGLVVSGGRHRPLLPPCHWLDRQRPYETRSTDRQVNGTFTERLAIRALDMAVALRRPPKDCIHHTDRGSQYCSGDYQKRLKQHGFLVSMSGKGNCYDCEYGIAA